MKCLKKQKNKTVQIQIVAFVVLRTVIQTTIAILVMIAESLFLGKLPYTINQIQDRYHTIAKRVLWLRSFIYFIKN